MSSRQPSYHLFNQAVCVCTQGWSNRHVNCTGFDKLLGQREGIRPMVLCSRSLGFHWLNVEHAPILRVLQSKSRFQYVVVGRHEQSLRENRRRISLIYCDRLIMQNLHSELASTECLKSYSVLAYQAVVKRSTLDPVRVNICHARVRASFVSLHTFF